MGSMRGFTASSLFIFFLYLAGSAVPVFSKYCANRGSSNTGERGPIAPPHLFQTYPPLTGARSRASNQIPNDVKQIADQTVGIFKKALLGVDGFFGLVKLGFNLMELIQNSKDKILLFDKACTKCDIKIKCASSKERMPWFRLDEDDSGLSRRFTVGGLGFIDLDIFGKDDWTCYVHDAVKNREQKVNAYGGMGNKEKVNLWRIEDRRIYRVEDGFKVIRRESYW